jgi:hypothetical protein
VTQGTWGRCTSVGYVPCNGLSINLPNGMLYGNHIAARGFRGMAGRVPVEFSLVHPEQEFTLFP